MSPTTLRVVLAPRASLDARLLLREAAALARALDAELAALFVEESDLLTCVALPFTVEVGVVSGIVRDVDPESMRRLMARREAEVRAFVAQTARALDLPWSFAVTRGDLVREALAAVGADVVVLAPPRTAVQHALGTPPSRRPRATVGVLDTSMGVRVSTSSTDASTGSTGVPAAEPQTPVELVETPPEGPDTLAGARYSTGAPTSRAADDAAWTAAVRLAGGRRDQVARLRLEEVVRGPAPRVLVVSLASVSQRPGLLERVLASAPCPVVLVA